MNDVLQTGVIDDTWVLPPLSKEEIADLATKPPSLRPTRRIRKDAAGQLVVEPITPAVSP